MHNTLLLFFDTFLKRRQKNAKNMVLEVIFAHFFVPSHPILLVNPLSHPRVG